nr:hypothetical protein [Tanacetum cinerariifolium]
MENLHNTEHELEIDFNKPVGEQDPIIKLNDLARKKRKHADDIHDYFMYTKKYNSLVQYKDHLTGTVLNEPSLGMIMFNSHQRQDFVSIKDFRDFTNEMMYEEIVGSVPKPFRLLVDLNIKSPKGNLVEDKFNFSSSEHLLPKQTNGTSEAEDQVLVT